MSNHPRQLYKFGPFLFDTAERLLLRQGKPVPLSHTAFDVLSVLVENSGHLVEKEKLMQQVWQGNVVEDSNLTVHMATLREALGDDPKVPRYIKTVSKHGYRFIASVRRLSVDEADQNMERQIHVHINAKAKDDTVNQQFEAEHSDRPEILSTLPHLEFPASSVKLEPIGGAVSLESKFYITRTADEDFRSAVTRQDSIVLVKGARQIGKTSLLARGLQQARLSGAKIILTDFQNLNAAYLKSVEKLLLTLAESVADQLDLNISPTQLWNAQLSPGVNFERYLRREVFVKIPVPIVWAMDEVDRLFTCDFGSEIFGLFRSWHNKRALDPAGAWHRLTLAITFATEAHLFINDLNQSPFNVGTRLLLEDFTFEQVAELNRRYGSPLRDLEEVAHYFLLLGGQPYLVRRGFHEMDAQQIGLASLEADAKRDEGLFGDHLDRLYVSLSRDAELCDVMRGVLRGEPCPTLKSFYRLRSAGVIVGDTALNVRPRCQLYADYLERHLL